MLHSNSIDLAIADVPYFVRGPTEASATSAYIHRNGMKARFNEAWDRFDSIEQYEAFCTVWIDHTMRCLNDEGSLFIFGTYHNAGLINRICQMNGHVIINEIIWVQRNGRPNVATRRLQASHQNILWIAKDSQQYRFNYRLCKRTVYDDWLSKPNQQTERCLGYSGQRTREHISPPVAKAAGGAEEDFGCRWKTRWPIARSVQRERNRRRRSVIVGDAFSLDRTGGRVRADDPRACRRRIGYKDGDPDTYGARSLEVLLRILLGRPFLRTHVKVPYPPPEQLLTHSRISKSAGPDDTARLLGLVTVTMCVASDRSGRWGHYTQIHWQQ